MKSLYKFLTFVSLPMVSAIGASDSFSEDQMAFFEKEIRPVLVDKCYKCHSKEHKVKGELLVDSRQALLEGGSSGKPAIEPGKADESELIKAIRYHDEDMQMPPKKKLPDDVIKNFEKWVNMGAPDPREATSLNKKKIDIDEGRQFWSFQPLTHPAVPTDKSDNWSNSSIDKFIFAKLKEANIEPIESASAESLLRRIYFDLTGLPPKENQINAFKTEFKMNRQAAVANVLDQLLSSDEFGAKWGRHWLDLARYADTVGSTFNVPFRNAWRYRNWVVDAMNRDMPINQFISKQIAGDLMPWATQKERDENLIATGYLMLGSKVLGLFDKEQLKMDVVDEQLDVIGKSILGLTLGCARCHDHKFDPVTHKDYYALAGIFTSTHTVVERMPNRPDQETAWSFRGLGAGGDEKLQEFLSQKRHNWLRSESKIFDLKRNIPETKVKLKKAKDTKEIEELTKKLAKQEKDLKKFEKQFASYDVPKMALAVLDFKKPEDTTLRVRGVASSHGDVIPRGFIEVARYDGQPRVNSSSSGRLELAQWITDSRNPLTARVFVNRVWHHLFNSGIVRTTDNFGLRGELPSHPELLDHLVQKFIAGGWRLKPLIREIIMTQSYQLSTKHNEVAYAKDPENRLFWKQNRRRLGPEEIRDTLLKLGGELVDGKEKGLVDLPYMDLTNTVAKDIRWTKKRTVYQPIIRGMQEDLLEVFDFADNGMPTGTRATTQVAPQALYMMNSPFVRNSADLLAIKIVQTLDRTEVEAIVNKAFLTIINRAPDENEVRILSDYLRKQFENPVEGPTNHDIGKLCQALYSSTQFQFLD